MTNYGQLTVDFGLDTLEKNLKRVLLSEDKEEEDQKMALSLSILNFFKTCSNSNLMKKYLEGKK